MSIATGTPTSAGSYRIVELDTTLFCAHCAKFPKLWPAPSPPCCSTRRRASLGASASSTCRPADTPRFAASRSESTRSSANWRSLTTLADCGRAPRALAPPADPVLFRADSTNAGS
eukprot:2706938-Rhodomonas_salina.1